MTMSACKRPGLRVLIAEDNVLISEFMRLVLIDLDYAIIGPFTTLGETLRAIETTDIDGALLDMQLGADDVLPAAKELARRGVPFILTTGRETLAGLPAELANAPLLAKPFEVWQLEAMVTEAFRCSLKAEL